MTIRRSLAVALAALFAFAGVAETTPRASAAERPSAASVDQVRADAMARLAAGDVQNVDRRRNRYQGGGWSSGSRWSGRSYGRNRGWSRGRSYGRNRYYGGRRYYDRRDYRRYRNRDRNIALGVGAAALALGAVAAANQGGGYRGSEWCARRYRTYDPASGTYIASPGVRRSCP